MLDHFKGAAQLTGILVRVTMLMQVDELPVSCLVHSQIVLVSVALWSCRTCIPC
jgi:hypothetical protein